MDGRFSRAGSRLLRPLFQCLCWEDCGHGNTFSIHLRCYAVQGRSQGHGKTKIPLGRRAYSSDGVLQTRVLDGRSIAAAWQDELSGQVEKIKARGGRPPGLGVILVGDRLDSQIYVSRKQEACQRIGIKTVVRHLPTTSSQMGLRRSLLALCADHTIDGVLIQLPLPPHIDEEDIIEHIPPGKDVDGFHPLNVGRTLMRGCTARFVPCTALGCVELLRRSHIPIAGKNVAIIGDSNIVGMPLAMLFRDEGASTVTVVHRTSYSGLFRNDGGERSRLETSDNRARADACLPRTPNPNRSVLHPYKVSYSSALRKVYSPTEQGAVSDITPTHLTELANITNSADILVVAVGYPHLVTKSWIKPGAVVLDVGINVVDDEVDVNEPSATRTNGEAMSSDDSHNLHVTGDVDMDDVLGVASAVTPVPGGVGPMTIAAVLHNTVYAAALHLGLTLPVKHEGGNKTWPDEIYS